MTDIIEAARLALYDTDGWDQDDERKVHAVLAAVTPLIRAAALEEAALVADKAGAQEYEAHVQLKADGNNEKALIYAYYEFEARVIAAAIRSLKVQP